MDETKEVKPLSTPDMAQGLMHEREIAVAKAQLDAALKAQEMFVVHLHNVYRVPQQGYVLRSWLTGFEPIGETTT